MLYIILKHFLSWFQKCFIYEILSNPSIFMKIYDLSGQNDNFRQKIEIWSCDALFHSKSSADDDAIGFVQKFYPWRLLAVKNIFFSKIIQMTSYWPEVIKLHEFMHELSQWSII